MKIPFYIVDVFAEKKYSGNQLAVFLEAEKLSDAQMQQLAREINFAESTFVTSYSTQDNSATIKIFTPEYEMKFAGHPIVGTSWLLMNKIFTNKPESITMNVPIGAIPVKQSGDLVWLQAAQPQFLKSFSTDDFSNFSNLKEDDFNNNFSIEEVTTGSAFIIVPLKTKQALENLKLDTLKMDIWLKQHCTTSHRALYFFCFDDEKLYSRMLYIEDSQIKEDAATGSASTCLQAYLLKNHSQEIEIINHQGDFINRPSQIYFKGELKEDKYDINIGGKTQFLSTGEWEI